MKLRSLILASLTLSLCVAGYVLAKSENGQAADKITGGLVIVTTDKTSTAEVEFTAHAATGDRPAKGMFRWYRADIDREIVCDVTYVTVNGAEGAFVGPKTVDTKPGPSAKTWLIVRVKDGGSPGTNGDSIGFAWFDTEEQAIACANGGVWPPEWPTESEILAGNLVVHSK